MGDDARVDLWLHPWVPQHPCFRPNPIYYRGQGALVVVDPLGPDGKWDTLKLQRTFSQTDSLLIQAMRRPWMPVATNEFGLLPLRVNFLQSQLIGLTKWWVELRRCWKNRDMNRLWSSLLLPRHKLIFWMGLVDALPSRNMFARLFSIDDVACPLCGFRRNP